MKINPFKKMNQNTYLTASEIAELKRIKSNSVNDGELSEFKAWLEKHGKNISIDDRENRINTWSIIREAFMDKIAYKEGFEIETDKMIRCPDQFALNDLLHKTLVKLPPEYSRFREYSLKLNLSELGDRIRGFISTALNNRNFGIDFTFDVRGFITDPAFDTSIYSAKHLDPSLSDNTEAIAKAYENFFNTICGPLNNEQKNIVKNNFMQSLNLYFKCATPDMIDKKGSNFRELTNFVCRESQKINA